MPCRSHSLKATVDGFYRSGVDLIAYNDKCNVEEINSFSPAGLTENLGSYYFFPKLSILLNIDVGSLAVFSYSLIVVISYLSFLIASFYLFSNSKIKIIANLFFLILSFLFIGINDYYVIAGALPMAFFPWLFIIKEKRFLYAFFFFFISILIISILDLFRSHSGTALILIFLINICFFSKHLKLYNKVLLISIIVITKISVNYIFNLEVINRVEFLNSLKDNYPYDIQGYRLLWHNIYYSLGFLNNNLGYDQWQSHIPSDTYSLMKALSINPNITLYSKEYDIILRNETFRFIIENPVFFLKSLSAKFGVLVLYFLIFCNIGLLYFKHLLNNKEMYIYIFTGLLFNSLFGILVLPEYQYLMGFIFFSLYLNMYNLEQSFNNSNEY